MDNNLPTKHSIKASVENGVAKFNIVETAKYVLIKLELKDGEKVFAVELYFEGNIHHACLFPYFIDGNYYITRNFHSDDIFFARYSVDGWEEKTELEYQTDFKIKFGEEKWKYYWDELKAKARMAFVFALSSI